MTWMVGSRGCITPVTVNTSGALNWGCSIFGQPHWHNHPETRETNRTHVFANGVLPAWNPRNSSFLWVVDGSPIISTLHFPSFSHGFQFPTHSGQLLVTTPFSFPRHPWPTAAQRLGTSPCCDSFAPPSPFVPCEWSGASMVFCWSLVAAPFVWANSASALAEPSGWRWRERVHGLLMVVLLQ